MSAPRRQRGKTPDREARRGGTEYQVGYGRPPKRAQFKPGQSGNPKGRPKGAKNEATIWRSVFNKKVAIREGGRQRKVSLLEAMILKLVEDALKGNPKTAAFVLNRYRLAEGDTPATEEADQDDREVFEAFVRRLEADVIEKKRKE
jgi:hypothetical protein